MELGRVDREIKCSCLTGSSCLGRDMVGRWWSFRRRGCWESLRAQELFPPPLCIFPSPAADSKTRIGSEWLRVVYGIGVHVSTLDAVFFARSLGGSLGIVCARLPRRCRLKLRSAAGNPGKPGGRSLEPGHLLCNLRHPWGIYSALGLCLRSAIQGRHKLGHKMVRQGPHGKGRGRESTAYVYIIAGLPQTSH